MRIITINLSYKFKGFNIFINYKNSSSFIFSLIFTPIQLSMPLINSICAPFNSLVLSPIHKKCALLSKYLILLFSILSVF